MVMQDSQTRFIARVTAFDENRQRQIASAASAPIVPEDLHMLLEDYLHITRVRRSNALPLFRVQMTLLSELVSCERAIAHYKAELIKRADLPAVGSADKADIDAEIRSIKRELHFHEMERRAIRDIGDGIAWRLFDYDRAILQELASRASGKHVNLEGIEAELHEFGHVFNSQQGIAILNDLTHFLKLGDLTIRKDDGSFEFIEVKTKGKTGGRITRQRQDLRRTVTFFNVGEREEVDGRQSIVELQIRPETFAANINRLIAEASKKGTAVQRIGEHLIVGCVDFLKAVEIGDATFPAIPDQIKDWLSEWAQKDDLVIDCLSADRYLEVKSFAPVSIFPFSEAARVKLMTGALSLMAFVNVSEFLKYCEQRGWKVVKTFDEHLEEAEKSGGGKSFRMATIQKGPLTLQLPGPLVARLGFEFLKPKTLVDAYEAQLALGEPATKMSFPNFSGEPEIWD